MNAYVNKASNSRVKINEMHSLGYKAQNHNQIAESKDEPQYHKCLVEIKRYAEFALLMIAKNATKIKSSQT